MKIRGSNPNATFARTDGHVVQVFSPRGNYWRKWPKKRPGVLPPVTEAQASLWDVANSIVKFADASEFTWASQTSLGTAFYARDILISAMYGNYVSWPGVGFMADGPLRDEGGNLVQPLSRARPRASATGRSINSVRSYDLEQWLDDTMTVEVTLNLPATNPQLFMSCEPYSMIPKKTLFGGQYVPHGYKQFAPSLCGQFTATSGGPVSWEWDITPCCPAGGPCFYWVGEQDPATEDLIWSGIIRPCPSQVIEYGDIIADARTGLFDTGGVLTPFTAWDEAFADGSWSTDGAVFTVDTTSPWGWSGYVEFSVHSTLAPMDVSVALVGASDGMVIAQTPSKHFDTFDSGNVTLNLSGFAPPSWLGATPTIAAAFSMAGGPADDGSFIEIFLNDMPP